MLKGYSAEKVAKSEQDLNAITAAHAQRVEDILSDLDFSDWDTLIDDTAVVLTVVAMDGAKEGLMQVSTTVGKDALAQANEQATAYAKERSGELVGMKWNDDSGEYEPNPDAKWQITESTREFLRSDVTDAMAGGWSNDELSDKLEENYAFSDERADMIARTETARADVQGNIEGFKASGVVESKQWLTAPDCCDECQEIDGETVALDDNFSTGDDGPPLHPNCRCAVLPVVTDSEDET